MSLSKLERLAFMGDPALDTTNDPLAIGGLRHVFVDVVVDEVHGIPARLRWYERLARNYCLESGRAHQLC